MAARPTAIRIATNVEKKYRTWVKRCMKNLLGLAELNQVTFSTTRSESLPLLNCDSNRREIDKHPRPNEFYRNFLKVE
jgi:hypothetical protein